MVFAIRAFVKLGKPAPVNTIGQPLKTISFIAAVVIGFAAFLNALTQIYLNLNGPDMHQSAHTWWLRSPWGSTAAVSIAGGLVACFLIGPAFYFWAKKPPPQPAAAFRVEIRSLQLCANPGPLTSYLVVNHSPQVMYPVRMLGYVKIANLQSVPSEIQDYKVSIGDPEKNIWRDTTPRSLRSGALFLVGGKRDMLKPEEMPSIRGAIEIPKGVYILGEKVETKDLESSGQLIPRRVLDTELGSPIPAHGTVGGWIALGTPNNQLPGGDLKFVIRDSAGVIFESVVPWPTKTSDDLSIDTQAGLLDTVHPSVDLRNVELRSD